MLGGRKANIKVGGDFGTIPADKYTVQIADVNFKMQFNKWKNEEEEKLNFKFVVLDEKPVYDEEGNETEESTRGKFLWHTVSQSLSTRSWLMKLAKATLGRDLAKEELDSSNPKFFNPESLVGKQVSVMVSEEPNKDGTATFNNVKDYSKVVKKLEPFEIENAGQSVVDVPSRPITEGVETPNLNPTLDSFLDGVANKGKTVEKTEEPEDQAVEEAEEEESIEELEAKIKLAKAKAKAAKKPAK